MEPNSNVDGISPGDTVLPDGSVVSKSRLRRLKVENLKAFGIERVPGANPVKLIDRPPESEIPRIPEATKANPDPVVVFETPTSRIPVRRAEGTELAVPVDQEKPIASPEQLQAVCRQWAAAAVQKLVEHAMSDDYRASLPAIQMLMNRGFGKERDLPEASPQATLVASLPVRERIRALLAARDAGGEDSPAVEEKPAETAKEPSPPPAGGAGQEMGNATG